MENVIEISGARAEGLKGVDMELPLGQLICFTGRSSNGRRAMALDVLFAESRRRYMHALSPVEREGISGGGKIDLDSITGLPPAIYLGSNRKGCSVGDFLQLQGLLVQLALQMGQMNCLDCGGVCKGYEPAEVEIELAKLYPDCRCLILAPVVLRDSANWLGVWQELRQAGFMRVMIAGEVVRLDGEVPESAADEDSVYVVVDRLQPKEGSNVRFLEAVRLSRFISLGLTKVLVLEKQVELNFNQQPTCVDCGRRYEEMGLDDLVAGDARAQQISLCGRPYVDLAEGTLGALSNFMSENVQESNLSIKIVSVLAEACRLRLDELPMNRRLEALSGGEWQRLQLAACTTSGLMGILYIFDGIGAQVESDLLPAVIDRLRHLVGQGNTALLIDHEPMVTGGVDQVWEFIDGRAYKKTAEALGVEAVYKSNSLEAGDSLAIRGDAASQSYDIELPHGKLICLHGPSGCGKTRLLSEILPAVLRGRTFGFEVTGIARNNRVVAMGLPNRQDTLLAVMGIFEHIAGLYAESAAAKAQGWKSQSFMLDKPGGRCASCEGLGQKYFDLEFLEDVSLVCEQCEGLRFRSEVRDITLRGISISDVLRMTVDRASRHFARDKKISPRLEAAVEYGLGYLSLGQNVQKLERGEWVRLRLACESTRANRRDWFLIDEPAGGDHPEDVELMAKALQSVVQKGATVVVADRHPTILQAAEWLVDLTP